MNRKFLALALSAGMIFAACGNNTDTNTNTNTADKKTETKVEDVKDSAKDAKDSAKETKDDVETAVKTATSDIKEVKIDLDGAVNKFKETFGDEEIAIEGISLELENGEYEIEGRKDKKEYSLTLDANTADIKAQSEEDDDDNETAEPIDFASIISPEEAMDKALTGQEDSKVVEWSLSTDDGKTKYDIDVENGDDKEVDALTGDILQD